MAPIKASHIVLVSTRALFLIAWILACPRISIAQDDALMHEFPEIENLIKKSEEYVTVDLDSSLNYAIDAHKLALNIDSPELKIDVLINLGKVYSELGDFSSSLDGYLQAKTILDDWARNQPNEWKVKFVECKLDVHQGLLYYIQGNLDKCLAHYDDALVALESVADKANPDELIMRKLVIFNNIAGVWLQKSDFATALQYYQNSVELNKTIGNSQLESTLSNNIGICYLETGDHELASHYFLKSYNQRKADDDKRGQAQTLNNMGKNMVLTGRFKEALQYYNQALELGRETSNKESVIKSLESLSHLNDTLGNYKTALSNFREFKALNDSMFGYDTKIAISKLEDSYRREKEKRIAEIEAKRLEAEKQKFEIRNISIGIALVSLLLLSILIIGLLRGKMRNSKLQQEKLALERQKLEIESQALQERLDYQDRELTANALYRFKINELITKITDNLLRAKTNFKSENQKAIQEVIAELRASQDDQVWSEFEAHFTKVHSSFYQTLQEKFPNLTANERKLCAFLRLNMSTKDISAITNQSVNSITVARSRLRKKLNIEGEEVNLINFLSQL